ncbi:hypothetical protein EVAR_74474_1 [Eumeta japonica]|uniref:Uncharacterized protein n=1 Tax=Eumeta variegata TaxID=151549 RepID=A0A4C1TBI4_EUMVA|nr:hypothetical protein EVAR_74474_1 [Eumeta japonica]
MGSWGCTLSAYNTHATLSYLGNFRRKTSLVESRNRRVKKDENINKRRIQNAFPSRRKYVVEEYVKAKGLPIGCNGCPGDDIEAVLFSPGNGKHIGQCLRSSETHDKTRMMYY